MWTASGLASVSSFLRLMEKREPGPSPGFSSSHAVLAFLTIGGAKAIGRQALAERSGLGEGSIRTVLKKLRNEKFVVVDATGCRLTESGLRLYESMLRKIVPPVAVAGSPLTVGASQVAVLVRSSANAVGSGIDQRDSAIRVGARGATTYVIKHNRFAVPGGSQDCEKDFPGEVWSSLREQLKPKDGDAVIVCGAEDQTTSKLGALSAALTLV